MTQAGYTPSVVDALARARAISEARPPRRARKSFFRRLLKSIFYAAIGVALTTTAIFALGTNHGFGPTIAVLAATLLVCAGIGLLIGRFARMTPMRASATAHVARHFRFETPPTYRVAIGRPHVADLVQLMPLERWDAHEDGESVVGVARPEEMLVVAHLGRDASNEWTCDLVAQASNEARAVRKLAELLEQARAVAKQRGRSIVERTLPTQHDA